MIIHHSTLSDNQKIAADICIIGGGPAAISMALQFAASSLQVIMITGGGWTQTAAHKDLYRGLVFPKGSHEPLEKLRRRQFGGGSAVWAGRCVPYDPIDFKPRSWVADSGWPIKYEELLPYFQKACNLCQIGPFNFDARQVFPETRPELIPGFDNPDFVSYPLERYSPPVHFAKTYKPVLEQSQNIRVLLDAHVVSFKMLEEAGKISQVEVAAGTKRLMISAAHFVLASGGIENARLLLASANEYYPSGLGNLHDNVGRYYMTHITGTYAKINPLHRDDIYFNFEKDNHGVFCRRRWWMPEEAQVKNEVLNTIFYPAHARSLSMDRNPLFSAVYTATKYIFSVTGIRESLRRAVIKDQYPRNLEALFKLGMPAILPPKNSPYWGLFFSAEQTPNRESRIKISTSKRDALGMPRAEMHIAFNEIDIESIVTYHNLFAKRFKEKNIGEMVYNETGLRIYLKEKLKSYNSYAHHIGTTRMSEKPQAGVVDKNAQVWGLENLFIAGASTFPSGGHANPTVTVIAQSLRLAQHLKKILEVKNISEKVAIAPPVS